MQIESLLAFCAIALVATATPGPAALLVTTNSLMVGFKKSLITVIGNITGLFLMSGFSVLGLSALVLHSSIAFTIIKFLGAIYLIFAGLKIWVNGIRAVNPESHHTAPITVLKLYLQGLFVAITNPKAIIFSTALFPQFVVVSEPLLPQFSMMVASFMTLSFVCLSVYALAADKAKKVSNVIVSKYFGKIFGSTFIGAGLYLAAIQRNN